MPMHCGISAHARTESNGFVQSQQLRGVMMKAIVLGAGRVGSAMAIDLAKDTDFDVRSGIDHIVQYNGQ